MRFFLDTFIRRSLVAINILTILGVGPAALPLLQPLAAQEGSQQGSEPPPPKVDAATLDTMVARVALYPDPLLAQVLAAATFAEQVPDGYKWASDHKSLKGDALAKAMDDAKLGFDPSVQSLLAFPSVLEMMNKDLPWTQKLGDAVLVQRGDVMDAVQRMRKKAKDAGNLKTSEQIKVVQSSPTVIEIQPPSPTVIYVPTYSPQVVYVAAPPPPPGPSTEPWSRQPRLDSSRAWRSAIRTATATGDITRVLHGIPIPSSSTMARGNRTWVNHNTYVHTWGGSNAGFYSRSNAYVNHNTYVRHNTNVNVNNNVNVNRNVNVNQNINANRNVNVNQNVNANRNVNANQNANVNRNANVNQNVNRNAAANSSRGYAKPAASSSGAFSGVQNGKSERAAGSRGRASRGR